MGSLASQKPSNTFDSVLHIEDDTAGLVATSTDSRIVQDGVGQSSALALSTDSVRIIGTSRLYINDVGGEYISGDGTDLHITSGADIYLSAGANVSVGDPDSGAGGTLFKTMNITEATATTFFTIPATNQWAGIIEIVWNASDDTNRSGYQLSRFHYDDAFTSLIADSQTSGTVALTLDGTNMQFEIPAGAGGPTIYRCKFRIMGGIRA